MTLKLDSVMALDDILFILAFKAMSNGEFISATIAMSAVIGWCSAISKIQYISDFQIRETTFH